MVPRLVLRAFHRSVEDPSRNNGKVPAIKQMATRNAQSQNNLAIDENDKEVVPFCSLPEVVPPVMTATATAATTATTARATSEDPAAQTKTSKSGMTTVYIGPKQQRFKVNKKLLCAASPFFRERIEDPSQPRSVSLWLPGESPSMFALFVEWLHDRYNFSTYLEGVLQETEEAEQKDAQETHWALVRLHLFASHLRILSLQDNAMDAIQDLYLRCDWDVTPGLISYLYTKCEAIPAVRLRRWAVAMVAYTLSRGPSVNVRDSLVSPLSPVSFRSDISESPDHSQFRELIESLKEFGDDYAVHIQKLQVSGLEVRSKNPQVRVHANKLRNEEREHGFRECSFHSHRATVGEKRCPHERKRLLRLSNGTASKSESNNRDSANTQSNRVSSQSLAQSRMLERMSRPLCRVEEEPEPDQELKHMRSISSTLR